jgi:hypothetical protein
MTQQEWMTSPAAAALKSGLEADLGLMKDHFDQRLALHAEAAVEIASRRAVRDAANEAIVAARAALDTAIEEQQLADRELAAAERAPGSTSVSNGRRSVCDSARVAIGINGSWRRDSSRP